MKLALLVTYWIALFVATHLPPRRMVQTRWSDKLNHVGGYAILAGLLFLVLLDHRIAKRRATGLTLAVCLLFGAIDEWTQPLVGRSTDLLDWLADATGAVIGVSVALASHVAASRSQR